MWSHLVLCDRRKSYRYRMIWILIPLNHYCNTPKSFKITFRFIFHAYSWSRIYNRVYITMYETWLLRQDFSFSNIKSDICWDELRRLLRDLFLGFFLELFLKRIFPKKNVREIFTQTILKAFWLLHFCLRKQFILSSFVPGQKQNCNN